jgi:hypothetical protein
MSTEDKTNEGQIEAAGGKSSTGTMSNPSQTILARKMRKVLDSQLETDFETQEALKELSNFFTENTLKNRRYLRGEIERRSLQINVDFLENFAKVKEALDGVHGEVMAVSKACSTIQDQLEATKSRTRNLVAQTTSFQERGNTLQRRDELVKEFLKRYQLTPDEIQALESRPIGSAFFQSLERASSIHADCRKWLASSGGQQTTALHIMEEMTGRQEAGVQRLYRWTVDACRSTSSGSGIHPVDSDLLPMALAHLQKARPTLVQDVIDEYCQARRTCLTRAFLDALTLGGPGGTPRPIELHAHDPQRYVGDMLAYLHQATPAEKENIYALVKYCDPVLVKDVNNAEQEPSKTKDKAQICEESLASITEGACRPLRSRVEQILLSEHEAIILYQLTNLIRFYCSTIGQVIPVTSELINMLEDLDQLAYTQFLSVLQASVQHQTVSRMAHEKTPNQDLAPTPSNLALLSLLKDLLSSTSVIEERPEQQEEIVATVLDPLSASLTTSVASFPSTDQDVFLLNSLYQIHSTLGLFKFNDIRLTKLENEMDLHLDTLSSEQTSSLIANLGLQPICTMIASHQDGEKPLSHVEGMDPKALRGFLNKFDAFLVAPDDYLLVQIKLLTSSSHRKSIAKRSLQLVAATYRQLFEAVYEPKNAYNNPESLMNKTPEQVELLLHL